MPQVRIVSLADWYFLPAFAAAVVLATGEPRRVDRVRRATAAALKLDVNGFAVAHDLAHHAQFANDSARFR